MKYRIGDIVIFFPEGENCSDLATVTELTTFSRRFQYKVSAFGIKDYLAMESELFPLTPLMEALL